MTTATQGASERAELAPGQTSVPPGVAWDPTLRASMLDRLTEISALEADWDGYGAKAVHPLALRRAQALVERSLSLPIPAPRLFPIPDGGVQLEWTAGPVELELEIEPGGYGIFVCDDSQAQQRLDGVLPGNEGLWNLALARLVAHA